MFETEAPDVGSESSHPLDALVDALADVGGDEPNAAPESAPEPASSDAPAASADLTGQPRDPAGRFAPKASAPAGTADPSATDPSAPAAPTAASAETAEAATPNPPIPFTPPPGAEPVYVTADRARHDIPGSFRTPDGGMYLPPTAADKALHFMGLGIHHSGKWQQEREADRREILTLKHQMTSVKAEREAQYEAMTSELSRVLSDPSAVETALTNPHALLAHLQQHGELALYKYKAENPAPAVPPELAAYDAKRALYAEADSVLAQAEQTPELGPILRGPHRETILTLVQRELDRAPSGEAVDWAGLGDVIRRFGAVAAPPPSARPAVPAAQVSAFNAAQQKRTAPTPAPRAAAPKPGATSGKKVWSKEAYLRGEVDE